MGKRNAELVKQSGLNSFPTAFTSKDPPGSYNDPLPTREVSGLSLVTCGGHKITLHRLFTFNWGTHTHHANALQMIRVWNT